jgi:hypothetical protein
MEFGNNGSEKIQTRGQFRWLVAMFTEAARNGYRLGLLTRSSVRDEAGEAAFRLYKEGDGPGD